jgi:hypothetical protein
VFTRFSLFDRSFADFSKLEFVPMRLHLAPILALVAAAAASRVAVVTGATRGIGRGIAVELGRASHPSITA